MTAEDKELLMRDLCARLPYNVKAHHPCFGTVEIVEIHERSIGFKTVKEGRFGLVGVSVIKPFLRPMSSMTEKEEAELYKMASSSLNDSYVIFDWLNKNYFAYRTIYNSEENKWENMFDKGLALVAPKEMYKIG